MTTVSDKIQEFKNLSGIFTGAGGDRIPPHGTPLAQSLNPEEQDHPEDNWVWSPQGQVNMHLPWRWGAVEFE